MLYHIISKTWNATYKNCIIKFLFKYTGDHLIVVLILQKILDFELFSYRNLNCLHIGIDQKAKN